MTIQFDGVTIKCANAHSHLSVSGGEVQAVRTHFWGIKGNSEILSTSGIWRLQCTCWLNDGTFVATPGGYAALRGYLKTLRELRGTHGTVVEQFTTPVEGEAETVQGINYTKATFEGFQEMPFQGQEHTASPIVDSTGLMGGGWILQGTLSWTLLRDDEE
jgi:hypothetical protein